MGLFDKLFGRSPKAGSAQPPVTGFTASADLMNEDQFWHIIHTTKNKAKDDYEQQQEELDKELRKLAPDDVILFDNRFRYFRGEANTWELWGAIYIINGGCSDDSFNDFREWVIGQGKDFYYRTVNDPESLAEIDSDKIEETDLEGLGYVADTAFKELTGKEIPALYIEKTDTTGTEWEEEGDDLKKMFPKLSAKYPAHI
ncbi:MAG: DUF4240 domain-containing protein [Chitinophagaceae bacterium]